MPASPPEWFEKLLHYLWQRVGLNKTKLGSPLIIRVTTANSLTFYPYSQTVTPFTNSDIRLFLRGVQSATPLTQQALQILSVDVLPAEAVLVNVTGVRHILGLRSSLPQRAVEIIHAEASHIVKYQADYSYNSEFIGRVWARSLPDTHWALLEQNAGQVLANDLITLEKAAQDTLTKRLHTGASIRLRSLDKGADSAHYRLKEIPLPVHYPHTSVPDHAARLVGEGKVKWQTGIEPEQHQSASRKGDIYPRTRSHYDRDYLQENAEKVVGLVVDAVRTNDPALSQAAEQTLQSMHVIAEAVAKREGNSLSQASRKINVPLNRIADYVRKKLIPVMYKDRGTIYLANSTLEELGRDYQDATEMGMQPARLLRERHDKYFPREHKS
jgi:hypothetical protein